MGVNEVGCWHRRDKLCVDLSGKFPMLRIPGNLQRSGRDQLYPMAPEFAELLEATPEGERRGRVFKLQGIVNQRSGPAGSAPVSDPDWVSHVVSRIARAAGVKVDSTTKRDRKTGRAREVVKRASAHDLRRSFGFRWSRRIMPAELRELMRHADIGTTMQFYVGRDAETTADALWAAYREVGNTLGNTRQKLVEVGDQDATQTIRVQGFVKHARQDSNLQPAD